MTKPTLKEANAHFKLRTLYSVDVLDFAISRNLGPDTKGWIIKEILSYQYIPPHLRHSVAYLEKNFPKDKPKWKKS